MPFSAAIFSISRHSFLEPICEPPRKAPLLSSVKPVIEGSGFSGSATQMNFPCTFSVLFVDEIRFCSTGNHGKYSLNIFLEREPLRSISRGYDDI